MGIFDILSGNTFIIGLLIVTAFVVWKFIMQPIMNEGQPIEPPKDYKSIPEQLEEATRMDNVDL